MNIIKIGREFINLDKLVYALDETDERGRPYIMLALGEQITRRSFQGKEAADLIQLLTRNLNDNNRETQLSQGTASDEGTDSTGF